MVINIAPCLGKGSSVESSNKEQQQQQQQHFISILKFTQKSNCHNLLLNEFRGSQTLKNSQRLVELSGCGQAEFFFKVSWSMNKALT